MGNINQAFRLLKNIIWLLKNPIVIIFVIAILLFSSKVWAAGIPVYDPSLEWDVGNIQIDRRDAGYDWNRPFAPLITSDIEPNGSLFKNTFSSQVLPYHIPFYFWYMDKPTKYGWNNVGWITMSNPSHNGRPNISSATALPLAQGSYTLHHSPVIAAIGRYVDRGKRTRWSKTTQGTMAFSTLYAIITEDTINSEADSGINVIRLSQWESTLGSFLFVNAVAYSYGGIINWRDIQKNQMVSVQVSLPGVPWLIRRGVWIWSNPSHDRYMINYLRDGYMYADFYSWDYKDKANIQWHWRTNSQWSKYAIGSPHVYADNFVSVFKNTGSTYQEFRFDWFYGWNWSHRGKHALLGLHGDYGGSFGWLNKNLSLQKVFSPILEVPLGDPWIEEENNNSNNGNNTNPNAFTWEWTFGNLEQHYYHSWYNFSGFTDEKWFVFPPCIDILTGTILDWRAKLNAVQQFDPFYIDYYPWCMYSLRSQQFWSGSSQISPEYSIVWWSTNFIEIIRNLINSNPNNKSVAMPDLSPWVVAERVLNGDGFRWVFTYWQKFFIILQPAPTYARNGTMPFIWLLCVYCMLRGCISVHRLLKKLLL